MARYLFALLTLVITCMFIASCNSNSTDNLSVNLTTFNDSVFVDSNFTDGGTFSLNKKDLSNNIHILSVIEHSPMEAFIMVDHKPVVLIQDSTTNYNEKSREITDHYSNKDYELTTDLIRIKTT